jgi:hypothetical protein
MENIIFPKVSKGAVQYETQKLSEISVELEDAAASKFFLECTSVIQRTLTRESASSLLSLCPVFFLQVDFLQGHMKHLTGGNGIFVNAAQHYEFQMELIFQYLQNKLPKKDGLKVICHIWNASLYLGGRLDLCLLCAFWVCIFWAI